MYLVYLEHVQYVHVHVHVLALEIAVLICNVFEVFCIFGSVFKVLYTILLHYTVMYLTIFYTVFTILLRYF